MRPTGNRLSKSMANHRDLFLIACFTGLRFSDWPQIDSKNIKDGALVVKQVKTGKTVTIPLHPVVRALLAQYENGFKLISAAKSNKYIKTICDKAKIDKKITTHTARRSFCTNAYLAGDRAQSIMKISGHSNEATFLRYLKLNGADHAKLMQAESKFFNDAAWMSVA